MATRALPVLVLPAACNDYGFNPVKEGDEPVDDDDGLQKVGECHEDNNSWETDEASCP